MSHGSLSGLHDRIISHIDLDCFYVGVERYVNPSLKDKPVAVVSLPTYSLYISGSYPPICCVKSHNGSLST